MFSSKSLISIIMPAYNAELTILESIESVCSQTYKNWELIVVDDGSRDNTYQVVSTLKDPRIKVFQKKNGGASSTRNFGIKEAKGKWIAFLDADDLWLPEKLRTQIAQFEQSNPPDLSYTDYIEFDSKAEYAPKPFKHIKGLSLNGNIYEDLMIHNFIATLTVMVRKEVLDDVGGFDESLSGPEDWDLWIRIAKKYPCSYLDKPLAKYRLNPLGLSKNYKTYEKELWKVMNRHLLASDCSSRKKQYGLWLFYRHMAHGFARNGQIGPAFFNLKKAWKALPLSLNNWSSLAYVLMKSLKPKS